MPVLLDFILREYGSNPFEAFVFLFQHGGGLVLIPFFIYFGITGWRFWNREHFKHHVPHTMFKIEVPRTNEQSMKAVEQIFVQMYGTYNIPDWYEKWWLGFDQEQFSFEVVSDGGYITFYLRCPTYYKEVVQAAFYAHYPDAILTETEDYVGAFTVEMINSEKIKVWGCEMKLELEECRPIKPYPAFEHQLAQKAVDPLANILEFMSRMQSGEQLWYQVLVQPSSLPHLKHLAEKAIAKIVEPGGVVPGHGGPDLVDKIQNFILGFFQYVNKTLFDGEVTLEHEERDGQRQRLTSPEREFVEEVDRKASRWPFHTKVRYMYFASPKLFDAPKARRGMLGALRLYRFLNALDEGKLTRTEWKALQFRYFFPKRRLIGRARRMFWAYRSRDMERGEHEGFLCSTEEITSLFHFPSIEVRAPFITKAVTRGVEPPTLLQYEGGETEAGVPVVELERGVETPQEGVPGAVVTERVIPEGMPQTPQRPAHARQVEALPTVKQPEVSDRIAEDPDLFGPQPPSNLPFL